MISASDANAVLSTKMSKATRSLNKGELIEERTENSKVFYNGNNSYRGTTNYL